METQARTGPQTSAEQRVINWADLMERLGDEEVINEVIPIFLEDNGERMAKLAEAVQAGMAEDVKLYAHSIKGAAANVGAEGLSALAYRLECAGRQKDMATAVTLLRDVEAEFEKVVKFLSEPNWAETAKRQSEANQ